MFIFNTKTRLYKWLDSLSVYDFFFDFDAFEAFKTKWKIALCNFWSIYSDIKIHYIIQVYV